MYWDLGGVVACLGTAFMAAGLTMGLLSIDPLEMAIKVKSGTPAEQRQARRIAPLLAGHHRLLVTLLLFNAAANEALPLFLDKLVPSYAAILISVTFVLFVGEIIPSAIFTGPSQLAIASSLAPFVRLIMFLSAPVTLPIARALDWMLGHGHGVTSYNRRELQVSERGCLKRSGLLYRGRSGSIRAVGGRNPRTPPAAGEMPPRF
jgi:metal transporter CNNM